MEDKHGRNFVAFPSREKQDGSYEDIAFPLSKELYASITGAVIDECKQLVEKKEKKLYKASSGVFDRLVIAGERLMAVIRKCQGMANKDLAKFADQINSLCDKWDR